MKCLFAIVLLVLVAVVMCETEAEAWTAYKVIKKYNVKLLIDIKYLISFSN